MEYRHVHYWHYRPGKEEEMMLEEALALTEKDRHDAFLSEIAAFISKKVNVKYVLIGRLSEDQEHIHSLVFMEDGKTLENVTYALKGTPCEKTMGERFCYHPLGVAKTYPKDRELSTRNIESYLGSILLSEENEPIGLIVLMDEKPIKNAAFAEHLVMVLSPAIEEEIKMMRL